MNWLTMYRFVNSIEIYSSTVLRTLCPKPNHLICMYWKITCIECNTHLSSPLRLWKCSWKNINMFLVHQHQELKDFQCYVIICIVAVTIIECVTVVANDEYERIQRHGIEEEVMFSSKQKKDRAARRASNRSYTGLCVVCTDI